jgi:hypothetical protein
MTFQIIATSEGINWDALARAYRDADTPDERAAAFHLIVDCIAADMELSDEADFEAGAITFLRNRGLWQD